MSPKLLIGTVKLSGLRLGRAGIVRYLSRMTTPRDPLYAGYRYPAELISYAVWLYFRFPWSLRMVEEMLAARGIAVTYETIRQWCLKFGQEFANRLRRRAPRRGDKWHLDEVLLSIAGKKHWLWRAVDQEGFVLDVLVQSRCDKKAAKRLFRELLKKQGRAPRVLITDKLRSYAAAKREIMPGVEHGGPVAAEPKLHFTARESMDMQFCLRLGEAKVGSRHRSGVVLARCLDDVGLMRGFKGAITKYPGNRRCCRLGCRGHRALA